VPAVRSEKISPLPGIEGFRALISLAPGKELTA